MDRSLDVAGRYRILASGAWDPNEVRLTHDPHRVISLSREQERELQELIREREMTGLPLLREEAGRLPRLYRLCGYQTDASGALCLETGETDYAEYLLTNRRHPEWRDEIGPSALSDLIGFSTVVVTADGMVPVGMRSKKVPGAGKLHVIPSGHAGPPLQVADWLEEELSAETGIRLSETARRLCTGLVIASGTSKPEITFSLESAVSFEEMLDRPRVEAWEFDSVRALRWAPVEAAAWLQVYLRSAEPPGHAAILLAGRAAFGDAWWEKTVRELGYTAIP